MRIITVGIIIFAGSEIQENKLGACVIEESRLVLQDSDITRNADGPLFMSECSSQLVSVSSAQQPHAAAAAVAAVAAAAHGE